MGDVTVEARDLTRRFGRRVAVDGVSFTARRGEVWGLVGRNGAGKTTLIRLLTTILAPDGGQFRIGGVPGDRPRDIRRQVGALPESAGYPEYQDGREYLRYHARLFGHGRAEASAVAERLLDEVDLAARARSPIATYSRGMRQRLGIARALIGDPAVIFLDEPTPGLDPAGQRQILDIIRGVADRRGATVILSSHVLPEVEDVCSHLLILHHGKVLAAGTLGEVIAVAAPAPSARVEVPAEYRAEAGRALAAVPGVRVDAAAERPGSIRLARDPDTAGPPWEWTNAALAALLAAAVPIESFDRDSSRLGAAFLAMTDDAMTDDAVTGAAP